MTRRPSRPRITAIWPMKGSWACASRGIRRLGLFHGRICHGGRRDRQVLRRHGADLQHAQLSMAWSRFMFDMPNLTPEERPNSPPCASASSAARSRSARSTRSRFPKAGRTGPPSPTRPSAARSKGGWRINGFKKFASLADIATTTPSSAPRCSRASSPGTRTRCCSSSTRTPRPERQGRLGPAGHARHQQPRPDPEGRLRHRDDLLMPRGIFNKTLPNWPHMMATLSPTYMGVAQGAYDFMVAYLQGQDPRPAAHRPADVCHQAHGGGQDVCPSGNMRALWWQAFCEAKGFPVQGRGHADVCRAIQRDGGRAGIAALAIRTCGGQSMLRRCRWNGCTATAAAGR
jgi:hypothetical protein